MRPSSRGLFSLSLITHSATPYSRPTCAGTGTHPPIIRPGAHPPPARAPHFLTDILTRVRYYLSPQIRALIPTDLVYSNVRHALCLANIVADSRYMLFTEFAGENGRRLKEYPAAVRTAVLAGLEHGGSDPFRVVL